MSRSSSLCNSAGTNSPYSRSPPSSTSSQGMRSSRCCSGSATTKAVRSSRQITIDGGNGFRNATSPSALHCASASIDGSIPSAASKAAAVGSCKSRRTPRPSQYPLSTPAAAARLISDAFTIPRARRSVPSRLSLIPQPRLPPCPRALLVEQFARYLFAVASYPQAGAEA